MVCPHVENRCPFLHLLVHELIHESSHVLIHELFHELSHDLIEELIHELIPLVIQFKCLTRVVCSHVENR